jgi:hypothetical protein
VLAEWSAETAVPEAVRRGGTICVPVGAIAQAWRSSRQVRLARLLKSRDIDVAVMTPNVARSVGLLCARSGHDDVIDPTGGQARTRLALWWPGASRVARGIGISRSAGPAGDHLTVPAEPPMGCQ